MRNLQEIIPAFFVGPGGQRLTPEQIAQREEVAKSLMAQATDTSPNAGGWASIASKGLMGFAAGRNRNAAERASTANAEANSSLSSSLLGSLLSPSTPSTGGGWSGMAPTADVAQSPSVASALMQPAQMVENQPPVPGLQAGQTPSILPQSFLAAVDRTEGAGGYDTLFGHAQKGAFKGTDISRMPIRDVIAFTDPSGPYAQSVKAQVGRVATPVGRYQVVGTTLRNAVGALGLDPNQPFDAATQDRVAAYLATNRIRSAGDLPSQISALRSEWEGFKNVPDDQMAQIIADLQNVDPMAAQPGAAASANIPMSGAAQEVAAPAYVDPMVVNPNSRVAPTPSVEVAQALSPQPNDGYFPPAPQAGGLDPAVIQALSDPNVSPQNKQIAMTLVEQYQARQQAAQEQARAEAARQQEITRRQEFLAANNLDPNIAFVDEAFAEAAKSPFRPRNTAVVDGVVVDLETSQPIYQAPQQMYRQVTGEEAAAMGLDPSKAYNIEPNGKVTPIGEAGVVVNNNMGEDKFGAEFAKLDAQALNTVATSGLAAQRNLGRIDQLEGLLQQSPSGFAGAAALAAGEWGIPTEGLDTLQAAQAAINSLVPEQRQPGSGPMSDADLALFKQSLPRIINQPGGNQTIINTMRGIAQYDAEGAEIVQQLRDGQINRAQAFERLQGRQNPLEAFKAPPKEAPPSEDPLPPQQITSKDQFDRLPSGTKFIDPQGNVRIKP